MRLVDLDQQATTPLAPEALAAMLPWLRDQHWNPHSAHRGGRAARAALEAGRAEIAMLLGVAESRILFTSGATEANNLALKGLLAERAGGRRRLLTFATEHSCVLESAAHLARLGLPVTILPVLEDGLPDRMAYRAALGPDVALVSAMRVNNEIGTIWPIAEMAAEAHAAGALFHCDAAQAFGKLDCRLDGGLAEVDMVSLSAHKIYGPKGIGALYVRAGVALDAVLDGGGQEAGIRSGTQSPALAAGFGMAARLARGQVEEDHRHARACAEAALAALAGIAHRLNGPPLDGPHRWPGNISLTFAGVDAGRLLSALPGLAFSSGAACSSGSGRPSHVLAALGLPAKAIKSTVRLGFGRYSRIDEIAAAFGDIASAVRRLRGEA